MSAEATNPAEQGSFGRRRGRPLIDLRHLRRFGRAALLGPAPRGRVPDAIEHVAKVHRAHHPGADLDVLRRAYELAESSHRGQMRKSGEPYITHPLAVTLILAELGAETTTLTASLLHDTVEDTEVTLAQVREQFGEEVRYLVDGVTKLEKVEYGAAAEPETFRKMLVATGNDVRVMSIKLADRLHNMRTLGVMRPEKQARIASVTRDVLIPLAERLGVQALKTELEDLVFAILHPDEYARTRDLVAEHGSRPDPLAATARGVRAVLAEAGIAADVLVRPRHTVSVYRVRRKRGELSGADLGRLLVLVGEDADCYAVLGELHTCFTPVISEFKDFIAVPKFNLYQSLHTAVAGADGKVIEVLIRTQQMHKVAEAGVVALGNPYAAVEGPDGAGDTGAGGGGAPGRPAESVDGERADPTRPGWLSRLLDWQRAAADTDTFWSSLRDDLAQDREITVFAADGTALSVPDGASCVDAVYARYGAVGHSCVGARVNGRLVTLSTTLHDGDSVEFLMATGRDAASSGPSPEWLTHARTPAARIAITHWLTAQSPPESAAGTPDTSYDTAPERGAPDPATTERGAADDTGHEARSAGRGKRGAAPIERGAGHGAADTEPSSRGAAGARGAGRGADEAMGVADAARRDSPTTSATPGLCDVPSPATAPHPSRATDPAPEHAQHSAATEANPGASDGSRPSPRAAARRRPADSGDAADTATAPGPVAAPEATATPGGASAPDTTEVATSRPSAPPGDRLDAAARPARPYGADGADHDAPTEAEPRPLATAAHQVDATGDDATARTGPPARLAVSPPPAPSDARGPATGRPYPSTAGRRNPTPPAGPRRGSGVVVDQPGATVRLAGCCTPVPPDEVTGFAVRGRAVTVHRMSCPAVARMTEAGRQPVVVRWQTDAEEVTAGYRVTLCAEAFSRPHLLADLTEVIAAQGAEVISAAVEPPHEQRVRHTYTLRLPDAGRLPLLMRAMRQVPSVYDVVRAGHELAAAGL
ncbi:HD domain-containing protein [Streptomyces sp. NPDC057702]|uniref:HD domain-containing protein n=1 Tax=unclassified Streptomyces TaxID=2593676 RepID=UPI0036BE4D3F